MRTSILLALVAAATAQNYVPNPVGTSSPTFTPVVTPINYLSWGQLEVANTARGLDFCITALPVNNAIPQLMFVQTALCPASAPVANSGLSSPSVGVNNTIINPATSNPIGALVWYYMQDGSLYSAWWTASPNGGVGTPGCLAPSFTNGALINQLAPAGGSHLLVKQCDGSLNQKFVPVNGRLVHYLSGQCVDVNGAKKVGTTIILLPCNSALTTYVGNDQWWCPNASVTCAVPNGATLSGVTAGLNTPGSGATPSTNWLATPPPPPNPPPSSPPPSPLSAPPPPPGVLDQIFQIPPTFSVYPTSNAIANGLAPVATSYTTTWTVPASSTATTANIVCVGGGGSGAYLSRRTKNLAYSGGGGGGGALSYVNNIPITPGSTTFTIQVGAGGVIPPSAASTYAGNYFSDTPGYGVSGGDSWVQVGGSYVVYAGGGGGGYQTQTGNTATPIAPTCASTPGTGALGGCGGCPKIQGSGSTMSVGFCGGNGGLVNGTSVSDYGYGPGGGGAGGYAGVGGNGGNSGDGDPYTTNNGDLSNVPASAILAVCTLTDSTANLSLPTGCPFNGISCYPQSCAPGPLASGGNGAGGAGGGAGGCYATQGLYDCSGAQGGGVGLWGLSNNGQGSPAFGMYQGSNILYGYAAQGAVPGGSGSCPIGNCPWGAGGGGYIYDGVDLSLETTNDPLSQGYGGNGACRIVLGTWNPFIPSAATVISGVNQNPITLSVTFNGLTAAQANMPAVQTALINTLATSLGVSASSITVVVGSSGRRHLLQVAMTFTIVPASLTQAASVLSSIASVVTSASFTSACNTALAGQGVTVSSVANVVAAQAASPSSSSSSNKKAVQLGVGIGVGVGGGLILCLIVLYFTVLKKKNIETGNKQAVQLSPAGSA